MDRRRYLWRTAAAGAISLAGCLERFGFEEESAWRNPPLVEDRPAAVYVPASRDSMGMYGRSTEGDIAIALMYSVPHRFWLVDGADTERVDVGVDDTHHLMWLVWHPATETVIPTELSVELRHDGERINRFSPWSMLSQRMAFHYGDNVALPGPGEYTVRTTLGPPTARLTGQLSSVLATPVTREITFEYQPSDINDLTFDLVDEGRRGTRGALSLMDPEHAPLSAGPPISELAGSVLGQVSSGDADISALAPDVPPTPTDEQYLAIFLRTPHNDVSLPGAVLTAETAEGRRDLEERVDPTLGHHYGTEFNTLPESMAVTVETPPPVARHDGYETAFLSFDPVDIST